MAVSEDENGNTVLTWTITNAPFEEHTLSFKENLKPDDKGIRPTGSLDTNEGDAVLYAGSTPVNAVETPVLPRGTSMTVEKVWKNDTADVRPDSVEVTLLRDGEAFETVELTEQGGWKYTWPALDPAYTWSVGETSVPEGYQSAVSGSGEMCIRDRCEGRRWRFDCGTDISNSAWLITFEGTAYCIITVCLLYTSRCV